MRVTDGHNEKVKHINSLLKEGDTNELVEEGETNEQL